MPRAEASAELGGGLELGRAATHAREASHLLRLRFTEGLPIRAIAARWGLDPDAVHRAYARAREEFHASLRVVVAEHAARTEAGVESGIERVLEYSG